MNVITYCTSDCQIHVLKKYNNLKHKALKCKADIFFNNCVVVSEGTVKYISLQIYHSSNG